ISARCAHVLRQALQPAQDRLLLATVLQTDPVPRNQIGRLLERARGERVFDGRPEVTGFSVPGCRAPLKHGYQFRLPALKLVPQDLGKKPVEAVPLASLAERAEKEVLVRKRRQSLARPCALEHRVAEAT